MKLMIKSDYIAAINSTEGFRITDGNNQKARGNGYHVTYKECFSHTRGKLNIDANNGKMKILPNETIVFKSKEYIHIPINCFGLFVNRVWNTVRELSMDATFIDPGYEGCLHVVIKNNGVMPIRLTFDDPIGKLVLFRTTDEIQNFDISRNRDDIRIYLDSIDQEIQRKKIKNIIFWLTYGVATIVLTIALALIVYHSFTFDIFLKIAPVIASFAITMIFAPLVNFIQQKFRI